MSKKTMSNKTTMSKNLKMTPDKNMSKKDTSNKKSMTVTPNSESVSAADSKSKSTRHSHSDSKDSKPKDVSEDLHKSEDSSSSYQILSGWDAVENVTASLDKKVTAKADNHKSMDIMMSKLKANNIERATPMIEHNKSNYSNRKQTSLRTTNSKSKSTEVSPNLKENLNRNESIIDKTMSTNTGLSSVPSTFSVADGNNDNVTEVSPQKISDQDSNINSTVFIYGIVQKGASDKNFCFVQSIDFPEYKDIFVKLKQKGEKIKKSRKERKIKQRAFWDPDIKTSTNVTLSQSESQLLNSGKSLQLSDSEDERMLSQLPEHLRNQKKRELTLELTEGQYVRFKLCLVPPDPVKKRGPRLTATEVSRVDNVVREGPTEDANPNDQYVSTPSDKLIVLQEIIYPFSVMLNQEQSSINKLERDKLKIEKGGSYIGYEKTTNNSSSSSKYYEDYIDREAEKYGYSKFGIPKEYPNSNDVNANNRSEEIQSESKLNQNAENSGSGGDGYTQQDMVNDYVVNGVSIGTESETIGIAQQSQFPSSCVQADLSTNQNLNHVVSGESAISHLTSAASTAFQYGKHNVPASTVVNNNSQTQYFNLSPPQNDNQPQDQNIQNQTVAQLDSVTQHKTDTEPAPQTILSPEDELIQALKSHVSEIESQSKNATAARDLLSFVKKYGQIYNTVMSNSCKEFIYKINLESTREFAAAQEIWNYQNLPQYQGPQSQESGQQSQQTDPNLSPARNTLLFIKHNPLFLGCIGHQVAHDLVQTIFNEARLEKEASDEILKELKVVQGNQTMNTVTSAADLNQIQNVNNNDSMINTVTQYQNQDQIPIQNDQNVEQSNIYYLNNYAHQQQYQQQIIQYNQNETQRLSQDAVPHQNHQVLNELDSNNQQQINQHQFQHHDQNHYNQLQVQQMQYANYHDQHQMNQQQIQMDQQHLIQNLQHNDQNQNGSVQLPIPIHLSEQESNLIEQQQTENDQKDQQTSKSSKLNENEGTELNPQMPVPAFVGHPQLVKEEVKGSVQVPEPVTNYQNCYSFFSPMNANPLRSFSGNNINAQQQQQVSFYNQFNNNINQPGTQAQSQGFQGSQFDPDSRSRFFDFQCGNNSIARDSDSEHQQLQSQDNDCDLYSRFNQNVDQTIHLQHQPMQDMQQQYVNGNQNNTLDHQQQCPIPNAYYYQSINHQPTSNQEEPEPLPVVNDQTQLCHTQQNGCNDQIKEQNVGNHNVNNSKNNIPNDISNNDNLNSTYIGSLLKVMEKDQCYEDDYQSSDGQEVMVKSHSNSTSGGLGIKQDMINKSDSNKLNSENEYESAQLQNLQIQCNLNQNVSEESTTVTTDLATQNDVESGHGPWIEVTPKKGRKSKKKSESQSQSKQVEDLDSPTEIVHSDNVHQAHSSQKLRPCDYVKDFF